MCQQAECVQKLFIKVFNHIETWMVRNVIFFIGGWQIFDHQYQFNSHLLMGNELCQGENTESAQFPSLGDKQKLQMSTAVPHENSSSHNELYRSDLEHDGKLNSKENLPVEEKAHEPQPCKLIMNSIPKKMPIKYEKMQVVSLTQKKKRINQFQIEVPFNIIFLTLSQELKHSIHEMGHDLFEKYYHESGTSGWKLHKNGYYINYLAKKLTAILTEFIYFQGELEQDPGNRIYPKSSGILLNQNGRFQGKFQNGKANGEGTFEDHIKNAFFKGLWKDGRMIEGAIDSRQYKFKGTFHENTAHGKGQLHFKQNQISYTGQFKKGKYYDKSGLYQTKQYIYEGCFINGKKNQDGKLVEKQRNYKNNKVKYKPPCQFSGFWSEDIYFSTEALASVEANKKTDLTGSKIQEEQNIVPIIQNLAFEQETKEIPINVGDQRVGLPFDIEKDFQNLKPKFIWVEPPRPEKKKKKKNQDEDSQAF